MEIKNFDWSKINLLIVDDDDDVRDSMLLIFRGLGVNTFAAVNGEEALHYAEHNNLSLILCDLQMPVMDGATLLRKLKEKNLNIPFVFITGQSHFKMETALQSGAKGLIYKPYDIKQMIHTLQNYLSEI